MNNFLDKEPFWAANGTFPNIEFKCVFSVPVIPQTGLQGGGGAGAGKKAAKVPGFVDSTMN